MNKHIEHVIVGTVGGFLGSAALLGAWLHFHEKPVPVVNVQPTAVIRPSQPILSDASNDVVTRAEQRRADLTWPSLTQLEINHLQMALTAAGPGWVTIFCAEDAYCGDLQGDLENAFETAHWHTELEKPMIDSTTGLSTSSPAIKEAIEKATSGRLHVEMIPKQASYFALVIGKHQAR